jgi:hypothetical protein
LLGVDTSAPEDLPGVGGLSSLLWAKLIAGMLSNAQKIIMTSRFFMSFPAIAA